MTELLPCRHRLHNPYGRHTCQSNKIVAPMGVDDHTCRTCALRDHVQVEKVQPKKHRESRSTATKANCAYRGDEIDRIVCPTCRGGKTSLKVFSCAKHSKCMINKAINGIKSCQECEDFTVKVEDGKVIACRAKASEKGGILFDEY